MSKIRKLGCNPPSRLYLAKAAKEKDPQIRWMLKQKTCIGLLNSYGTSYEGWRRFESYIYDQALAIMAFTAAGRLDDARSLINALKRFQSPFGGWIKCYAPIGPFYLRRKGCERGVENGPIVMVLAALNYYEAKTKDKGYRPMARLIINWLKRFIHLDEPYFGAMGHPVRRIGYGGDGRRIPINIGTKTRVSTEDNQVYYSAMLYRGIINNDRSLIQHANRAYKYLEKRTWLPGNVFSRGYRDYEMCSNPQSTGALTLSPRFKKSLNWFFRPNSTRVKIKGRRISIEGVSSCREDIPNCKQLFVGFGETARLALAYYSVGNNRKGNYFLNQVRKTVQSNGSVLYSVSRASPIWPCNYQRESLSATAWYYLAKRRINPFAPFKINRRMQRKFGIIRNTCPPLNKAALRKISKVRDKQIRWLLRQKNCMGLLSSYKGTGKWNKPTSHTYDQAVAIIALTAAGRLDDARSIIDALQRLQTSDGGLLSCYSAFPANADTGPVAWVLMALNFYEKKTGDRRYKNMANRIVGWLNRMRYLNGHHKGALKFSTTVDKNRKIVISVEHNHDAYSAFYYRGLLNKDKRLIGYANNIKSFLHNHTWLSAKVFSRGYRDYEMCTDTQSWGVLSLGKSYQDALKWLLHLRNSTRNKKRRIDGFSFCRENLVKRSKRAEYCGKLFVWLEGTLGVAAAFYSVGNKKMGDYFFRQVTKAVRPSGGVPYTISSGKKRWPCHYPYESAASTALYYLVKRKINPFHP
ncbi:MAG: prenyltransferase/squalene oxidase repeat-containing protein [Pseudomonadota bacterium]